MWQKRKRNVAGDGNAPHIVPSLLIVRKLDKQISGARISVFTLIVHAGLIKARSLASNLTCTFSFSFIALGSVFKDGFSISETIPIFSSIHPPLPFPFFFPPFPTHYPLLPPTTLCQSPPGLFICLPPTSSPGSSPSLSLGGSALQGPGCAVIQQNAG